MHVSALYPNLLDDFILVCIKDSTTSIFSKKTDKRKAMHYNQLHIELLSVSLSSRLTLWSYQHLDGLRKTSTRVVLPTWSRLERKSMEWNNGNNHLNRPTFLSHQSPASFNFLYNYNHLYPGTDSKQAMVADTQTSLGGIREMMDDLNKQQQQGANEKKKRMTSEQLEFLECRFREEMKLDPDRKIKLARELALQPRQVAVWFQNRRARWKTKQLEHLYLSLKHQLDLVSMEKHKLQEEVVALRAILKEEVARKQVWGGISCNNNNNNSTNTDMISGEDTVESTAVFPNSRHGKSITARDYTGNNHKNVTANHQCNYVFDVDHDYNNSANYWGAASTATAVMPCYP